MTCNKMKWLLFSLQEILVMAKSQSLRFDVTARVQNGSTVYEAVASIPGFRPVSVEKIEDGCTRFSTKSAITAVCNNRAVSLGMTPVIRYANETVSATTTSKPKTPSRSRTRTPKVVSNSRK